MNKLLKIRLDDIVNAQILDYVERTHSNVSSLVSSEPCVEVWDNNSHKVTRIVSAREDDQVLVVFRVSKKILFSFSSKVSERGLIFSKDGQVREAQSGELDIGSG